MVIVNNKIFMFGGILEVTKESDEVFIYDFSKNNWSTYESPPNYGNSNSPLLFRDLEHTHDERTNHHALTN